MLFDQFPNVIPEEHKEAAREYLVNEFNQSVLTGSEVCALAGIKQPTLSRIVAIENPPFAFKKGNTLLFITHYAMPWIEGLRTKQGAKTAEREANKGKSKRGPGRPKKGEEVVDDSWRKSIFQGHELIIPEEFATAEKWFNHICNQKGIEFTGQLGSPTHKQWLEVRHALKAHLGIQDRKASL